MSTGIIKYNFIMPVSVKIRIYLFLLELLLRGDTKKCRLTLILYKILYIVVGVNIEATSPGYMCKNSRLRSRV